VTEILSADLAKIVRDLNEHTRVADELAPKVDDTRFQRRPGEKAWSASECIQHLSTANRTMLPRIDAALADGKPTYQPEARSYSRDIWGWLLSTTLEPPAKRWSKAQTLASFVPVGPKPRAETLAEFRQLQSELIARVQRADGLALRFLLVTSPFNERLRYNVYSAFRIITAHNRRHLWQAQRAVDTAGAA
jgi:hypothetical protein